MAKLPIIGLAGKSRCGKDTAGAYLAKKYNAICIAQADPFKRYLRDLFEFTEEQLWGSQEAKETPDPKTLEWARIFNNYSSIEVKPNHEINFILGPYGQHAQIELFKWLDGLRLKYTDTPLSPRFVMQTFGTDFARALDPNIWSLNAIKSSLEILNGGYTYYRTVGLRESENKYDYVALLDIRFRNEILNLNKINAGVWKLYRKVPEVQNGIKNHASETGLDNIPRHFYDEVIDNNKTLKHLYDEIDGHMAINYGDDRVWR